MTRIETTMHRHWRLSLVTAVTAGAMLGGATMLWAGGAKRGSRTAVHIHPDSADFKDVGQPGVSKARLWGNDAKGPYGAFTKFQPGHRNDMHTHTNDIRLIVIRGAYIYEPQSGEQIRVEAGGYLHIPGGARHVSSADAKDGAVFYEESSGKFDLRMTPVASR